ncbi:MAG: cysteine--tRNA ligase [Solirubrobacterales bacterium]
MREVSVKDTASGERRPIDPGNPVSIYACGPTVYSRIHIGNARPFVVFSLFSRFLRSEGYDARLVVNVTDINDKIYEAATAAGVGSEDLAKEMTAAYLADTDRLGLGRPDSEPLASETIGPIISLIEDLIEKDHAYESGGDVYFSVRSFPDYGSLSHRDPDQMDQGEPDDGSPKRDPLDFALWKAQKEGEDTSWDSPWGPGRPGWHIECSAMAEQEADGLPLAIHGGGSDLVFPHHENEIAQSEAARGVPLARIWMHNGMIETDREKMSKSEGNIFQLSEALDRYGSDAVVSFLVSGHYRQPLAFGEEGLDEAVARNERIRNFFREARADGMDPDGASLESLERFRDALADDFNTPQALAELFDLLRLANQGEASGAAPVMREMLGLLGLEGLAEVEEGVDEEALALLAERETARAEGDFEQADELRDRLAELGWEVRDSEAGASLVRLNRS